MAKTKILIVDDDVDYTLSLQAILENQQYDVITAVNKTEGMEKAKLVKPDLVILDVMMDTTQEGFEMSRELRKVPEFKNKVTKPFCSQKHAELYKTNIKSTPRTKYCPRCGV